MKNPTAQYDKERICRVEEKVDKIMTNHLPHIDAKLDGVVSNIDWLTYMAKIGIGILVTTFGAVIVASLAHLAGK